MKKTLSSCISSLIILLLFLPQSSVAQEISIDTTSATLAAKELRLLQGPTSDMEAVAISSTGKILAAGGWDKNIYIYSLEDANFGEILHTFKHHTSAILSLSFDLRGQNLICGSNDHTFSTWNIDTAILTGTQRQDHAINTVIHGPSVKYQYSCSKEGVIKLWDTKDAKRIRTIDTKLKTNTFTLSNDKKTAYVAGESNIIFQYNLKGIQIGTLEGHTAFINQINISPSGALMASASNDKTVIIWELLKNKAKITLTGHTTRVNTVSFTSDNKYVISGDHSGEIIIWDIETGDIVKRIPGLGKSIRNLSVSRYMDYVAVASYENSGDDHVVYYCATGLINKELEMKRKASQKKLEQEKKLNEREKSNNKVKTGNVIKETRG